MRIPPPEVLATWPFPNYEDPEVKGPALVIINAILLPLVLVACAVRIYARTFVKKWFGIDDALIVLALIFNIGLTVVVVLASTTYGWNRHAWDLPFTMIPQANQVAFVAKLFFIFAATFTRLSLIAFYYRLVGNSTFKWFAWTLHLSVAWMVSVVIAFTCLTIWLCIPIESYWIFPPVGPRQCLHEGKVMLGGGVINTFSDLLVTVLPIPIVMRLQMPLAQRIGVCVLLSLGIVVTIAGAIRTYWTWRSLIFSWDETWNAYNLWLAAAVEIHLGIICACAPAWKSILHKPLRDLSTALSVKLSSLRSHSHASSSAARPTKPTALRFDPLRSLPWFQHRNFDFEKTLPRSSVAPAPDPDLPPPQRNPQQHDPVDAGQRTRAEPRDFDRVSDGAHSLHIMCRRSLDQCSQRLSPNANANIDAADHGAHQPGGGP